MSAFQINILTDIEQEPVTLAEIKAFSKIDADYAEEDTMLEIMRTAAREKLEGYLNLSFGVKTVEVQFTGCSLKLPYGPTGSLISVQKVDDDPYPGELEPVTDYRLSGLTFKTISMATSGSFGSIWYPIGNGMPDLEDWRENTSQYRVTYTTGYTTLPVLLKNALLIQIDFMIKNQGVPGLPDISPEAEKLAKRYSQNLVI